MSQVNVEVVRRIYLTGAFDRFEIQAFLAPDCQLVNASGATATSEEFYTRVVVQTRGRKRGLSPFLSSIEPEERRDEAEVDKQNGKANPCVRVSDAREHHVKYQHGDGEKHDEQP